MNKQIITDIVSNNYNQYKKIIFLFTTLFIVLVIFYFISENYRINIVLTKMKAYESVLSLKSTYFKEKDKYKLSDYYIASSFRSAIGKNQLFDYCSPEILEKVIESGARMVWLDIYNSDLSDKSYPVVSNGFKEGSWQLTLNTISFDDCCRVIATTAFKSGKVNNYNDPFFIALNLNTNNNLFTLTKMKDSIIKHLGKLLLGIEYGYNKINIGNIEMYKLCGNERKSPKVVIMTSEGFENSDLEEIVNYSWDNVDMKKLVYKSIDPNIKVTEYPKENTDSLKNSNSTNLTMITPEENTLFSRQYEPSYSWDLGCHFVCMYYQSPDKFMEQYINKFKNNSFILKPEKLRSKSFSKTDVYALEMRQKEEAKKSKDKTFSNCPLKNSDSQPSTEESLDIILKDNNTSEGVCFITDNNCDNDELWNIIPYSKHNLNFTIDENYKDIKGFTSTSVGTEHNSDSGSLLVNTKVNLCCSKQNSIDIKNKFVLSPVCPSPENKKGIMGLKLNNKEKEKISKYYSIGTKEKESFWIHPNLCNIKEKSELINNHFCLLSRQNCPSTYDQFETENNKYNLCCKK